MTTYALDTNIISYFLKGNRTVQGNFKKTLTNGDALIIPPIVYYEAKRGFLLNPAPSKEKTFERMCATYSVGTLDNRCLDCAAKLYVDARSVGHNAEDADLFIAAFCLVEGYILVTANTRHFKDIEGLKIENWSIE